MGSNPVQLAALAAAALCVGLVLFLLLRRQPKWAMVLWTAALFFTPVWLGANVPGLFVTALTGVTVLAIVSGYARGIRWSAIDSVVAVLFVAVLLAYVIGGSVMGHVQETLLVWFLPYIWGRIVLARVSLDWVSSCIAVAAVIAAVLGIAEFLTGQNLFLSIPGAGSSVWGTLQVRAGLFRVEGAFGHSIALGGTLAMASAFILVVRWKPWLRASALVIVGVATALTFSRLGIIGFAVTVLLGVVFLGPYIGRALRVTMLVVLAVGAIVATPLLLQIFGEAGAEAEGSANYRADLVPLLNSMVPLGVSPAREVLATGEDFWAGFRSIDSALILIGLRFGLVVLGIVLLLLVLLVISVLRGRANPASIALLAQIPAFATVALITQYAVFVWFAVGLAVASYTLGSGRAAGDRRDGERLEQARDVVGVA